MKPPKESEDERFRRLAEARVNKILDLFRLLGNLSGTANYAYSKVQVEQIFTTLQLTLVKTKMRFLQDQEKVLELCRKLSCGELRYLWQERKKAGDSKPIFEWLGGTSAEKLAQYGKPRPDGKSLSRVSRLLAAQKTDFLFTASSGPGEKDAKGLIVPRFGKKPENHVSVSMTWDSLAELLLITKTHYEAWLAAWYMSQTHSTRSKPTPQATKAPAPPKPQPAPAFSTQFTVPEYSPTSLF